MIDRRTLLRSSLPLLLWPVARTAGARSQSPLAPEVLKALDASPFVYVSPLRSDGSESTCHGEVWYAWLDGEVVLNTRPETWKARSVDRGLDRARIWVGDYGRWKRVVGRNEAFRKGPSFTARASVSRDRELVDRLLAVYETKYPAEIARWRDRMRDGIADGSRVMIRYVPEPGSASRSSRT